MAIVNIITSVKFAHTFDLAHVAKSFDGRSEVSRHFNAVTLYLPDRRFCQVFGNGKCIVNGGTFKEEAEETVVLFRRVFRSMGYRAVILSQNIVNIVAKYDCKRRLKLQNIADAFNFWYEPEIFPAVRIRLKAINVTVNIFHSGKCMILGAKTEKHVQKCANFLTQILGTDLSHFSEQELQNMRRFQTPHSMLLLRDFDVGMS